MTIEPRTIRERWKHWVKRNSQITYKLQRGNCTFAVEISGGHNSTKEPKLSISKSETIWQYGPLRCMGLWSIHYLHAILAKMFNQNLLRRKQTNPESETFFNTTELDRPKCQCHGGWGWGTGRSVLDKNGLKKHDNQEQYMIFHWILKLGKRKTSKKTF